jgi:acetylornithine deacetylase/succinyl-diaminopimelate desuccinylase-like protein
MARLGIPSIVVGPGDPAGLHVIDESITLEPLERGTALYGELLRRLLR